MIGNTRSPVRTDLGRTLLKRTFFASHGFIIKVNYYETHSLIHDKKDKSIANTYSKLMIYYIFSTKNRNPC